MNGRRLPLVIVLVGLLVAAIAVGNQRVRADAGVQEPAVAASIPAAAVRSSAWYCAGGPVGKGPSRDQVTVSNVGPHSVRVVIDVMVAGRGVAEHFVTVAGRSSRTFAVASLSGAPSAALVVQPFGGGVVVEQGYAFGGADSTPSDVAMAPCATRASPNWYFAAGSSVAGAQTWLSLLDPFGADAVVDVVGYTEDGLREPSSLQSLVVTHDSRLAVRMDTTVTQQRIVAVEVRARQGTVVATQSLLEPLAGGRTGASLSLGALAPAHRWMFADNRSRTKAVQQLVLANPRGTDATAQVTIVADVAAFFEPRVVRVPATAAVALDFSHIVPPGVNYTLDVRSSVPLVAETRDAFTNAADFPGLVTEVGAPEAAPRWWFAGGPFTATGLGGGAPRVPDGYDLAIAMAVKASGHDVAHVRNALGRDGHVRRFATVTPAQAFATFTRQERDNPALLLGVTAADFPTTFAVVVKDRASVATVTRREKRQPAVSSILSAQSQRAPVADDIVVFNPGVHAVHVTVVPSAAGRTRAGAGMSNVLVAPGHQVTISLVSVAQIGAAAVVTATGPIVAERFTGGTGVTRAPGVPGA